MSVMGVRRRWGVRRKTTAAAALLMIVVLLLAGLLLLEVLKRNIVSTAHDQAVTSQQQVLSRLVDGQQTPENRVIYVWSQADPEELLRVVGQPGVLVHLALSHLAPCQRLVSPQRSADSPQEIREHPRGDRPRPRASDPPPRATDGCTCSA